MTITLSRKENVDLEFRAPPSKSYTHRALIAAALAKGDSLIEFPLEAEDTEITAAALRALGTGISFRENAVLVTGTDGSFRADHGLTLDLKNSGTSMRLLTSAALLSEGPVILTGSARMQERPIGPLVAALNAAGGTIEYVGRSGFPPIRVSGRFIGGPMSVSGTMSSQFISSILLAAPYADDPVDLTITSPPASRSYLELTVDIMHTFGAGVRRDGYRKFSVRNDLRYTGRQYRVEGDYSSASYFFAIAALCSGRVIVGNLNPFSSQGDRAFLVALKEMGCHVQYKDDEVMVEREGSLGGIEIDMSSSPDTVQTLCAVAAVADSPTTITGIAHLKIKESDRIAAVVDNLRLLGGDVVATDDSIIINPVPLHGGTIDPKNDHRTAMSFAILGLATGGITITDPECVGKSYPGFWDALHAGGLL